MYQRLIRKEELVKEGIYTATQLSLGPLEVNAYLEKNSSEPILEKEKLAKVIKRPNVSLEGLMEIERVGENPFMQRLRSESDKAFVKEVLQQIEIELKYEGYIVRQMEQIERFDRFEDQVIPESFNFMKVQSLSTEGREKLAKVRPSSIGQASRISGVTPSDISVLMVHLKG
jgi:tRNA uridine 5-carboxymethylaminomethyl modification enzyme